MNRKRCNFNSSEIEEADTTVRKKSEMSILNKEFVCDVYLSITRSYLVVVVLPMFASSFTFKFFHNSYSRYFFRGNISLFLRFIYIYNFFTLVHVYSSATIAMDFYQMKRMGNHDEGKRLQFLKRVCFEKSIACESVWYIRYHASSYCAAMELQCFFLLSFSCCIRKT